MSEIQQIVEELGVSFEGEPWHGPSLLEILEGVGAKTAAAKPIVGAHSIWELVLHVTAWEQAIRTRIAERRALQLSDEQNFPTVSDTSEEAWKQAMESLRRNHQELVQTVGGLNRARLTEQVPGKPYDIGFML